MGRLLLKLVPLLFCGSLLQAQDLSSPGTFAPDTSDSNAKPATVSSQASVNWTGLFKQSIMLLGVQHSFRLLTEQGTREDGTGFGAAYAQAVGNLHGWADGDPFIVNYVGHPMQGSTTGFIWTQNDPAYRDVEFGRDRRYWKSRLRATAFSWAYSEQFEIGPVSEASIGHVQGYFPQQGLVDHVITPTVGLGWMIVEDAMDKYFIRRVDARVRNPYVRALVRGFLNPSRSMANITALQYPWTRDDRPGIGAETAAFQRLQKRRAEQTSRAHFPDANGAAPFEFTTSTRMQMVGGRPCMGGGGEGAWRISTNWQVVAEVDGCKMLALRENLSGDSLAYRIGPRWRPAVATRWSPYAQVLVGGTKISQEELFPALRQKVDSTTGPKVDSATLHAEYTQADQTVGLSVSAASGLEFKLNRAFAVRVASLEYSHNWVSRIDRGPDLSNNVQFSTGFTLRIGTW